MRGLVVTITDSFEEPPSDIVFKIDFIEGEGSAARPFQIAADLIRALEGLDATLVESVDSSIETTLIVEDLQKSSIKVFLRNALRCLDDDALKTFDWKPLVGQYLVRGKYAALRWLDEDRPHLEDLTEIVGQLAAEASEIHHLPTPVPPNPTRLLQSLDRLQAVKSEFLEGESLTITLGREEYRVDLARTWKPSDEVVAPPGEMELANDQEVVLMVRKPDMLGKAAWQFRLGKANLSIPIEDQEWLEQYRSRQVSLLPGDALQVTLRTVSKFSAGGELLETKQTVRAVHRVIQQSRDTQGNLFDE